MNRTILRALLQKHEGLRTKPYTDTMGNLTIGVGRNLTGKGLSEDECYVLLDNDINEVFQELIVKIPGFSAIDQPRQHAIMDMAFNLGVEGLMRFQKMLEAVEHRDWDTAAEEMLNSKWAGQVKGRATELATMIRTGVA